MEIFGDIERFVAQSLYPYRVPLAILALVALVGLVVVAWRRGWFAAMRRHPLATILGVVGLLVVLTPVTWYLASPLIITTSVVEAAPPTNSPTVAPAIATAESPAIPSGAPGSPLPGALSNVPGATPLPAAPGSSAPVATPVERRGSFEGADDFHFGRGTARLILGADGSWTVRFEDFAVRNGPDLFVYLSPQPDRYSKKALELGRLKADRGAFNYQLPAGTDPSAFRSVVVWCKQFAVQFAHATLTP